MLHITDKGVTAAGHNSLDGKIQRLSRVHCENYVFGRGEKERAECLTGGVDRLGTF